MNIIVKTTPWGNELEVGELVAELKRLVLETIPERERLG